MADEGSSDRPLGYRLLAEALEAAAGERGKLAKIERLAEALRQLEGARLAIAARLLSGSPFAEWEQHVTSAGWATLSRASAGVTGWDLETIGACAGAIGDLGEAVLSPREEPGPTILEVDEKLRGLASLHRAAQKQAAIEELLRRSSPVEAKYLVKTLSGGLRVGADLTTVEEAVARAFGRDREAVARAHRDCGDIGETAVAARDGRLQEITFRLFHPIGFMLATPIEDPGEVVPELSSFAIEEKFDGIRAHAHKSGSRVALFSRTLDEVTVQFPEITVALALAPGEFLLDGEIVAWRRSPGPPGSSSAKASEDRLPDGGPSAEATSSAKASEDRSAKAGPSAEASAKAEGVPDSFLRLQRRLGRKSPDAEVLSEVPTAFIAYDCLARGGEPLFEKPWRERRRHLEEIVAASEWFKISEVFDAGDVVELETLFARARARGNEGLMLKKLDSPNQAGKRGRAWRKWKKALATLDVVVTAVEQGHGKRAGMLSDYTFAVRDGDRFVNIGKAYSGLTDEEIRRMGTLLRAITTGRYGPVRAVSPEVVIEVAFDAIQKSSRHKSGYALRFPRIVRLRPDKTPLDVNTLQDVEDLFCSLSAPRHAPPSR